jgi:ArsR family transcriptional regulator
MLRGAYSASVKLKTEAPHHELFRALADPTRLRLLLLLREGEICVCHLVGALELSQPQISKHLAALRQAGLVNSRKDGLWRHYSLAEASRASHTQLLRCLDEVADEHPEAREDRKRLKKVLEAARCCD